MSRFLATLTAVSIGVFLTLFNTGGSLAREEVGLQVSPTVISPTIAAGDETRETVVLHNLSGRALGIRAKVELSGVEGGGVTAGVEPAEMTIAAGESVPVSVRVAAGREAGAGRVDGTILFLAVPAREQDVSIAGQVGVNLEIEVIVPVDQTIFHTPHLVDAGSPILFTVAGRNNGRFPTRMAGGMEYSGLLARDRKLSAGSGELAVGESTSMRLVWADTPAFSLGRVTLFIDTGVGAPVEHKAWLIIAPWRFLLALAAVSLAAAAGMFASAGVANVLPPNWRKGQ